MNNRDENQAISDTIQGGMTIVRLGRIVVLNLLPSAKDPDTTSDEPAEEKDHHAYHQGFNLQLRDARLYI